MDPLSSTLFCVLRLLFVLFVFYSDLVQRISFMSSSILSAYRPTVCSVSPSTISSGTEEGSPLINTDDTLALGVNGAIWSAVSWVCLCSRGRVEGQSDNSGNFATSKKTIALQRPSARASTRRFEGVYRSEHRRNQERTILPSPQKFPPRDCLD